MAARNRRIHAAAVDNFNGILTRLMRDLSSHFPGDAKSERARRLLSLALNTNPLCAVQAMAPYFEQFRDEVEKVRAGEEEALREFLARDFTAELAKKASSAYHELGAALVPQLQSKLRELPASLQRKYAADICDLAAAHAAHAALAGAEAGGPGAAL